MAKQVQLRRGTTAEHAAFTGVEGELTVDTTKDTLVLHDAYQVGGYPLLREDTSNLSNDTIDIAKIDGTTAQPFQAIRRNAAGTALEYGYNKINQVKHGWLGTAVSSSGSNNYVDLVTVTITPVSTSSRFLVVGMAQAYGNKYCQIRTTMNGNAIFSPSATHGSGNGTGDDYGYLCVQNIAHPNTTAQVTFKLQGSGYSSGTATFNSPPNSGCSLTIMEVMDYA